MCIIYAKRNERIMIVKKTKRITAAMRVSLVSVAVNVVLSLLKLACGIAAKSQAMVSDALHSASDVASTVIVIIGLKISEKEPDTKCQYGYERFECGASIILSALLFATGAVVGYESFVKTVGGGYASEPPGRLALYAALVSIAAKEWMFRYTMRTARQIGSSALSADAYHHRSDSLSSIGSFIGIFGARLGLRFLDSFAGFIISLLIIKASYDIFKQSASGMIDRACDDETAVKIRQMILSTDGVCGLKELKTRMFGAKIYVEAQITADCGLSLKEAYEISESVSKKVEREFANVKKCSVRIIPDSETGKE